MPSGGGHITESKIRVTTNQNADITLTIMSRTVAAYKRYPYNYVPHDCGIQTLPLQLRPARLQHTNVTLTIAPCTVAAVYCEGMGGKIPHYKPGDVSKVPIRHCERSEAIQK
jgi:hypothetical protein